MSFLLHLWQSFLALHPWGYVTTAVLALVVLTKRKVISTTVKAIWKRIDAWFWEKMRTKLQLQQQTQQTGPTQLKTYSGMFQDYVYRSTPHNSHTLTISGNGFLHSVPVNDTHLFMGIKKGTFIEVDTEATVGLYSELVKRVRVGEIT
jgi:hypothetical protein